MDSQPLIDKLLASPELAIRYKVRVNVLGEDAASAEIQQLQQDIKQSATVRNLLKFLDHLQLWHGSGVYAKWQGAHWALAALADLGYPPGDEILLPVKDELLKYWLSPHFYQEFEADSKARAYQKEGVPVMQGRHRRCAAQQGNALYLLLKLGLYDERIHQLTERLLHWQWPDGGWNCDKHPDAGNSSFMETLLPLRGLALYAQTFNKPGLQPVIARAAEVFLKRHLYRSQSTGKVINPEFTTLHYPLYWHYDILGGLKVMAEAGFIHDACCADALALLKSKQLPDGGWPAEKAYYKTSAAIAPGADFNNWGGTSKKRLNEWVSADALFVLNKAGLS